MDAKCDAHIGARTIRNPCLVNRSIDVIQKLGPSEGNRVFKLIWIILFSQLPIQLPFHRIHD